MGINGFEARIPYVKRDTLLIECDKNLVSPSVSVVSDTGRELRFTTEVFRGGFLLGLRGTATDGKSWNKNWTADFRQIEVHAELTNWLPIPISAAKRIEVINRLVNWSGLSIQQISAEKIGAVRVVMGADQSEIDQCEKLIGHRLCDQYRELLRITNGFGIRRERQYDILGTEDIIYIDDDNRWIGVTPLFDDGYIAISNNKGVISQSCYLLAPDGHQREIGDLRTHVRQSLLWQDSF